MGEALVARYWCHMCSQMVSPVMGVEIKCAFCDSGFVEEMDGSGGDIDTSELSSGRSLSLWAPILLGMMGGSSSSRRRRHRRDEERDDQDQDRESVPSLLQRHRNSAIFRLIQELEDGLRVEADGGDSERERQRDRESLILIDSFNRALILQGALSSQTNGQDSENGVSGMSLGDYFLGPGLDLLLQHLAENDPNRYGTPPAQKEAMAAMPTVKITESLSCSVCLEEFLVGGEAKEMPCKHLFHGGCILPWLELHSSCPVCRFQMPADESKDFNGSGGSTGPDTSNGSRVPWPFYELFSPASSSSSSSNSGGNDPADEN